jgi:ADP-ribosylglycohydrolase
MTSDDTEHTCLVGQALLRDGEDPSRFARALAWKPRLWLLGLPAGIGQSTLFAIVRLWFGFSPKRSGVFSAGNGPAMRAVLLGVCLHDDPDRLRSFLSASTRITHTDPKAENGALLVARAAQLVAAGTSSGMEPQEILATLRGSLHHPDDQLVEWLERMEAHLLAGRSAVEFAGALKLDRGVTGYIYDTCQ